MFLIQLRLQCDEITYIIPDKKGRISDNFFF